MKPQCNTSADCLRELARVMEQFGISNMRSAINSHYTKFDAINEDSYDLRNDRFSSPECWQFAIAEVEGKPVFIGDELYYFDRKIIAGAFINGVIANAAGGMNYSPSALSWNPPKPATVMVELPYDVAEFAANNWARHDHLRLQAFGSSCKTALEKLK